MSSGDGVRRREFLKGAMAALPAAAACGGAGESPAPEAQVPAASRPLSAGVGLWGQDLGLGEAFADSAYATEARSEVEIYVQKCADHGVSRVFAPGASRELVEAGSAAGVEVHPYKAVASHGGIRMRPAWSSLFMVPRFATEAGRDTLNAHRTIWSHPQRTESLSAFLRDRPEHRHRNRTLTDEMKNYERVFLSPGLPEGRAEEGRAFAELLSRSGGRGIQAEFVSINEDDNGVTTDGYEDSIAGAFREATGRDPFQLPNDDPDWVQFRADRWTDMVRDIRDAVKAVRSDAVFTITVINRDPGGYVPRIQDWPAWVEQGLCDEMHLWFRSTTDMATIERHCRHFVDTVAGRVPTMAEFSCYHPGSLQTPEAMMEAARIARGTGMDGLGIYRSHAVEQLEFWPLLEQMTRL
ncbi:MAG: family 10 glycosylhydrolase [Acidobacteria bacterium]|nr:family 10 glycosylhydrolase [Acidobacteriota bacterium]